VGEKGLGKNRQPLWRSLSRRNGSLYGAETKNVAKLLGGRTISSSELTIYPSLKKGEEGTGVIEPKGKGEGGCRNRMRPTHWEMVSCIAVG